MDYLKIGKAEELEGSDKKLYRILEIFPGFLSWATLLVLLFFSYFNPVFVAYFIIAFDIYWLLLVIYLGIHLVYSYRKVKENIIIDWQARILAFAENIDVKKTSRGGEVKKISLNWMDIKQLVILPIYQESLEVICPTIDAIMNCGYPAENFIIIASFEARAGEEIKAKMSALNEKYQNCFGRFVTTVHPDGIEGEIKGKSSNQAWAAKVFQDEILVKDGLDPEKILVSVFDIDTIIYPQYFHCLAYKFLNVPDPYRASYQPIPLYHNNIWQAPFFARVAASSNTFWQMMQQIRQEKLATYSSHSMTWSTLAEIGFWSKTMVSEDSRIFWHCFCYFKGDYRVEPMYYPVSMDVTMDETAMKTASNLYKQQRRWGWGIENVPYLIFNTIKNWSSIPKIKFFNRILVQLYGFHSWATNALIIGVIGWMPMLLGGDRFNATVLSSNLPFVTRTLMMFAMMGLVLSAVLSTILLPKKPKKYGSLKYAAMVLQWAVLPFSIIVFGSVPGLEAQTRLMFGKYLGFFVTPKSR